MTFLVRHQQHFFPSNRSNKNRYATWHVKLKQTNQKNKLCLQECMQQCMQQCMQWPRPKTVTSLCIRVDRAPVQDLWKSAQQCFEINAYEPHHSGKASHPANFGTEYVSICSSAPLPGWHWRLHMVLARPSTSPTAVALCSYTDHVWASGVVRPERHPAQLARDGRKSSHFLSRIRWAIEKTGSSCMANVLRSSARTVESSRFLCPARVDLEGSPETRWQTSLSRWLTCLNGLKQLNWNF